MTCWEVSSVTEGPEGLTTLDPLITSPPPPPPTFPVLSSSSSPSKLTHSGASSEGPAVSELQTTISAPAAPHQLTSNSGWTESSTAEIPRKKEEKYNLLDTEGEKGEEGEKDKTNTFSRIKRGAQQDLRFVLRWWSEVWGEMCEVCDVWWGMRCKITIIVCPRARGKRYGYSGSRTFDKNLSNLSPIYKSK